MRLIDADNVIEELLPITKYGNVTGHVVASCIVAIKKAPTIDAEPVRHGHWKMRKNWTHMVCSACSFEVPYDMPYDNFNYCPNCGADMRGGDNT